MYANFQYVIQIFKRKRLLGETFSLSLLMHTYYAMPTCFYTVNTIVSIRRATESDDVVFFHTCLSTNVKAISAAYSETANSQQEELLLH